jgi:glycosyltransferase XagB
VRGVEDLPAECRGGGPGGGFSGGSEANPAPPGIPLELAFLERYGVARDRLAAAVRSAERYRTGVDAALLGEGAVSEEHFYRALADHLRLPYHVGGAAFDGQVDPRAAIVAGFVTLAREEAGVRAVVAPRGEALRFLLLSKASGRPLPPVAICSRQRLSALIRTQFGARIARDAACDLGDNDGSLTASTGLSGAQIAIAAALAALGIGLCLTAPDLLRAGISIVLWFIFASAIVLRSAAVAAADTPPADAPPGDENLPDYTVIAALHREGPVVGKLVRALDAIDYPGIR